MCVDFRFFSLSNSAVCDILASSIVSLSTDSPSGGSLTRIALLFGMVAIDAFPWSMEIGYEKGGT